MSDKDIINKKENLKNLTNDTSKNKINLFSLSHLKSKSKFMVSQFNCFNLGFCNKNNNSTPVKKYNYTNIINKTKNRLIDGEKKISLKTLNISVPSSQQLLDKKFQENFMNEYENSFADFCGIKADQFKEMYINNKYEPILDDFGDLNISIKSIIEILKTYSFSLRIKIHRRVVKKYRIQKIFKTYQKKNKQKKKNIFETNLIQNDVEQKDNNNNININKNNLNIDYEINNNNQLDKLLNLKKKLKISIQKKDNNPKLEENDIRYKNTLERNNTPLINTKGECILSNTIPSLFNSHNTQTNLPTTNNNYFNFSSNAINNYCNSQKNNISQFLNKKRANTPLFNNNNNSVNLTNNCNYNINLFNPIVSPNIFSPYIDYFTPSSHYFSSSNISSPKIFSFSPFYNNNMHSDKFTFANANRNSFFFGNNSPIIINNNNINSTYNIPVNNNSENNANNNISFQKNINNFAKINQNKN